MPWSRHICRPLVTKKMSGRRKWVWKGIPGNRYDPKSVFFRCEVAQNNIAFFSMCRGIDKNRSCEDLPCEKLSNPDWFSFIVDSLNITKLMTMGRLSLQEKPLYCLGNMREIQSDDSKSRLHNLSLDGGAIAANNRGLLRCSLEGGSSDHLQEVAIRKIREVCAAWRA